MIDLVSKSSQARLTAWVALATSMAGCALPRHEVGLDTILEQQIDRQDGNILSYRCTRGAHRGSSVEFTENTLKALQAADADSKYAFIEFDIQYSKDNRIVVFHDTRLLRVFGSLRTVNNSTLAELEDLTDGEVCAYDEAMDALRRKKLNIEIKSQGDTEEDARLADELIADLKKRKRLKDVMISSISDDVLRYIRDKYPKTPTGKIHWLTRSTYLHFDSLTRGLYEDLDKSKADYLMLYVANLRNIEKLLALKPKKTTIVFWDFRDNMYVVHKKLSDRIWGDSVMKNWFQQVRYRMSTPTKTKPSSATKIRER